MDPIFGGLISGGLGLIGNIFGTNANNKNAMEMQQQAQAFNSAQTLQQQQFQEQMSSTAYQRASKDMMAAGLNPAAMFGSGSAASSPSGAAASTTPAVKTSALSSIGPAMDRVVSSAISAKTFEKMTDEIANLKATNERIQAETATEREKPQLLRAQRYETTQGGHLKGVQTQTGAENLPVVVTAAQEAKARAQFLKDHPYLNEADWVGHKLSGALSPVGDIVHSAGSIVRTIRPRPAFDKFWP